MSGDTVTADDLLENPDSLDLNDEDAILALANGADEVSLKNFDADDEDEEQVATARTDKDGDLGDKGKESEKASTETKKDGDQEETPAPIQGKDGKHTIPYNVLETTRNSLKSTAAELEAQRQENERLRKQLEQGGDSVTEEEAAAAAAITAATPEEEFVRKNGMSSSEFKREYGEALTKSLMAQAEESLETRNQLNILMEDRNRTVQGEEEEVAMTVQDAIDAIPALAALQAEGGDKWKEAIEIDNALKALPKFRNNPDDYQSRFARVAEEMGLAQPSSGGTGKTNQTGKKTDTDNELDEATPTSISDLPGGSPAAQSVRESVDNMDSADLGLMFEDMTPAQQEEYLNSL